MPENKKDDKKKKKRPIIIIKKVEDEGHHGHHGGAWKVAYADFVTAMMAFFLLLWILNSVQEETLEGLADYFTPTLSPQDGVGGDGLLDGGTVGPDGTLNSSNSPLLTISIPVVNVDEEGKSDDKKKENEEPPEMIVEYEQYLTLKDGEGDKNNIELSKSELQKQRQEKMFSNLESRILQAVSKSPDLEPLAETLKFEKTPEGLRIQIIDQHNKNMFLSGSAELTIGARNLVQLIGKAVSSLPNELIITGHTDSVPMNRDGYTNWELSSDRANSTRRTLIDVGVPEKQVVRVSGVADQDPLLADDPTNSQNRRISIVLAYQEVKSEADIDNNMISYDDEKEVLSVERPQLDEVIKLEPNEDAPAIIDPYTITGKPREQFIKPVKPKHIITLQELKRAYTATEKDDKKDDESEEGDKPDEAN